jgi:flagellar basal body-associated protein FliL|tara:strand:- start:39 stop:251 length:213 start_codon:yes stop_codon:yes gene_type:complete
MLKTLIIIVVVLLLISLGASLVFLLVDQGKKDSKRTAYALGARVTFAVILILLIAYGLFTGELGNAVPWQ